MCRTKCLKHTFLKLCLISDYTSNHLHDTTCEIIFCKMFWSRVWCSAGVCPLSFFSSVYFLIWVHYWLYGGRDALSLVHRPQIRPLHCVPRHHPTPVHSQRNWHPEIHKVHSISQSSVQLGWDLMPLLLASVCWGRWQLPTCVWPSLLNIIWWRTTLSWDVQTTTTGRWHCSTVACVRLRSFKCESGTGGLFFRVDSWGSMFSVVPTICFGFQVRVDPFVFKCE